MSLHTLWQAVASVWALGSFYIGGLGVLIVLPSLLDSRQPAPPQTSRRRIPFNLLLIASGVAALALAFNAAEVARTSAQVVLELFVIGVGGFLVVTTAGLLLRGRADQQGTPAWWTGVILALRLFLIISTLVVVSRTSDGGMRYALVGMGALQTVLFAWEVWVTWRSRRFH